MEKNLKKLDNYSIDDVQRLKEIVDGKEKILKRIINDFLEGVVAFKCNENKRLEVLYANNVYIELSECDKERFKKKMMDITSDYIKEDEEKFLKLLSNCNRENSSFQCVIRKYKNNAKIAWYNINVVCVSDEGERLYLGFIRDVSAILSEQSLINEVARLKEQLSIERERYHILAETTQAILFEYRPNEDVMIFNYNYPDNHERKIINNYLKFLENTPLVHTKHINKFRDALLEACSVPTKKSLEYLSEISGKGYRWHRTIYASFSDDNGKIVSVLGRIYDVNEEIAKREEQLKQAQIDALTGAYMRKAGYTMMEREINKNDINPAFLVMLDIDNFKQVNDTKGHSYGDMVLKKISQKSIELIGDSGLVIRYGGDEFIFFVRCESEEALNQKLDVLHNFCKTISNEVEVDVDFSEGIVLWKDKTLSQAFEEADSKMYVVKRQKKQSK